MTATVEKGSGEPVRTIFMGTPDFAVPSLRALASLQSTDYRLQIVGVVTRPDRPVGRKRVLTAPPVKRVAEELGIPVLQPQKLKNPETVELIRSLKPDLIIVVAYGQIIPKTILNIPRFGVINVHGSLLPKYRGASPIAAAIASGESETGVTIMLVDELLDHGPILTQARIAIDPQETGGSLSQKLSTLGAQLLTVTIPQWISGGMNPREQDHGEATMTKLLTRDNGKINWGEPAQVSERKIRAYHPWPGTWTVWRRGEKLLRLNIVRAKVSEIGSIISGLDPGIHEIDPRLRGNNKKNGSVIKTPHGFAVRCESDALEIVKIQPEGRRLMTGADFLHGYPDALGSCWE